MSITPSTDGANDRLVRPALNRGIARQPAGTAALVLVRAAADWVPNGTITAFIQSYDALGNLVDGDAIELLAGPAGKPFRGAIGWAAGGAALPGYADSPYYVAAAGEWNGFSALIQSPPTGTQPSYEWIQDDAMQGSVPLAHNAWREPGGAPPPSNRLAVDEAWRGYDSQITNRKSLGLNMKVTIRWGGTGFWIVAGTDPIYKVC